MEYTYSGPKWLITDPCYVLDENDSEDEWKTFLRASSYRGRYVMNMVPYPYMLNGMKMIMSQSIPWGDISFSFRDQNFAADAGIVAIFEVANDYVNPNRYGIVVDNIDDALLAVDIAMTCWGPCYVDGKRYGEEDDL